MTPLLVGAVILGLLVVGDQILVRIRARHYEMEEITRLVAEIRSLGKTPDLSAPPRELLGSLLMQMAFHRHHTLYLEDEAW